MIDPVRADASVGDLHSADRQSRAQTFEYRHAILDEIARRPLLLDAAMGTRLVAAGLDLKRDDPALWCLTHAEEVAVVHRRDVASGADVILSNTFGANRFWLARIGQVDHLQAINARAVRLARAAAGPNRFVLGCIGPTAAQESGAAAEQAVLLINEDVDALLLETFRFPEIERALAEVTAALTRPVPVVVSLWEWPDPPENAAGRLLAAGAAVLGLNCQPGASAALAFARRLGKTANVPLLVKPGVGTRPEQAMSPADLAAAVPSLLEHNVRLIGGCCGTNEQHLAAVAACAPFHRVFLGHLTGDKA